MRFQTAEMAQGFLKFIREVMMIPSYTPEDDKRLVIASGDEDRKLVRWLALAFTNGFRYAEFLKSEETSRD